jgi:hypothetical protein
MTLIQHKNDERCEHFRINDTLSIQYKAIGHPATEQLGQELVDLDPSESNQCQVQLRSLQTAFTLVTDQINPYDPDVARALRILNDKITLIDQSIHRSDPERVTSQKVEVNLGGGGLALMSEQQFETKSPISILIELRSSNVTIQALFSVISCTKVPAGNSQTPYYLRLTFTKMNEQDRDLLIKHILFRQAEELRANNTNLNQT